MDYYKDYGEHPTANQYAEAHTSSLPDLHTEVLNFTLHNHAENHMISGHLQGQLLRFISHCVRPRRILEIGTFTGFSALCLAEGLSNDGKLFTLELREEDAATARSFFARSKWSEQIVSLTGDAKSLIPNLDEQWDLVFIDADKTGYTAYFDLVFPRLSQRGMIVADNVLFHGEVLQPDIKGKNAKAIAAFNEHVRQTVGAESVMLTVRDGLLFIRRR